MQSNLITATPAARATDPESSHLAAEGVTANGQRGAQQQAVLAAVRRWPGLTSAELAQRMGVSRYVPGRRLSELETAQKVRKGEIRRCAIGNRSAVTWWPA